MLKLHDNISLDLVLKIILNNKRIICIFSIKNHYIIDSTQIDDLQNYNEIQTEDLSLIFRILVVVDVDCLQQDSFLKIQTILKNSMSIRLLIIS